MDSMDLEREKGITIRAKNAAFRWNGYHVNIVDTPGHADFGGEVERIMKMVDGVLLVVDAHDGPQAQTKFVLRKALENGLKPIVVINKIDRENARPHKVLDMVFELFLELNATDEQLDFPIIYASAKDKAMPGENWSTRARRCCRSTRRSPGTFRRPAKSGADYFQILVSNLDYSDYLGRIAYGRIVSGRVKVGQSAVCHPQRLARKTRANVTAIFSHEGLDKVEVEEAARRGHRGHDRVRGRLHRRDHHRYRGARGAAVRPHRSADDHDADLRQRFGPLAGREGKLLTARQIRDRLVRETRTNVSLQVADTETAGHFEVQARGEMQIAILVEQMRREGFEILVSRPEVIFDRAEDGSLLEPMETLYVDVPNENLGDILQSLAGRKAEIVNMEHNPHNVLVEAVIPTRGLIGFETDLVNLTKGHGIASHLFKEYGPHRGEIPSRGNGVLVSMEAGISMAYALDSIQERGRLFIGPQRGNLRRHDRRRKRPAGRHAGESLQGQEAHQHAQPGRRQRAFPSSRRSS